MSIRSALPLAFAVVVAAACQTTPAANTAQRYPPTKKIDLVEDYHGTKVADPYRWMEDLDSKDVADWVAAQNQVSEALLTALPMRDQFRRRITELWNYPKTGLPRREGGRLFYTKNSGLQRQSPLYARASLTAEPTLVLDPNVISPDGSTSLSQWRVAPDGKLLAYALSEGGADWETLHVRDIDAAKDLNDEVKWVRFSDIAWTKDSKGFFYSRFPEPPKGKELEAALAGQTVYYHRVGTPQSADPLIYERKDRPTWFVSADTTEDGKYLLIFVSKGSDNNNRLYYADLGDPARPTIGAPIRALVEEDDAEFNAFGSEKSTLYLRTDKNAPNRKVIALDVAHPDSASWKTIVPESTAAIETVRFIGGHIVAHYLVDVQSKLSIFGLDGKPLGDVALPGVGSVAALDGRGDSPDIFFSFSSPLFPTTVFVYDAAAKNRMAFEAPKAPIDVTQFETTQQFATSKDGTRVPFFLTARKGLPLDGSHPTMIYGYGGFSSSTLPTYRADVPAWLEQGGVWVTANMRGGAEYGEAWHKAGTFEKKQNVFDDFVAVAESLVKQKYTSPGKLGIMGGSNGGLLIGAVEEQRPDLFAVALPAVGVMDMLRYDRFTGGRAWVTEYGSSSDPKQFAYLIKYSPLQNIKPNTCYPATLVTTADHDDRVVPSHSFKFTATMQAAQSCDKPVVIRVETQGSHGYRPTDKQIAERADLWAFAAAQMGIK
jgi:prolyl oligopeptidase